MAYLIINQVLLALLTYKVSFSLFGGGMAEEEEEAIPKGDDVVVELDATLEDLYMGGSLKVILLAS